MLYIKSQNFWILLFLFYLPNTIPNTILPNTILASFCGFNIIFKSPKTSMVYSNKHCYCLTDLHADWWNSASGVILSSELVHRSSLFWVLSWRTSFYYGTCSHGRGQMVDRNLPGLLKTLVGADTLFTSTQYHWPK